MSLLYFEYSNISVVLACICVLGAIFYFLGKTRKGKLPPGPTGLPVVGYLPFLTNMPHLKFEKLASKYGNIFSLQFGSSYIVVLNKGGIIKEAFSKPEFLGRPPDSIFNAIENFESPFFSSGKAWQEQRRFALQTMRDLGFGKSRMEKHILDEIECFLQVIKESNGDPMNIKDTLTPSMSNNICSLVFGNRYKYDDPERMFLDNTLEILANALRHVSLFAFFPWVQKLPFISAFFKQHKMREKFIELQEFMNRQINQHEKTLDPDNIRDYIDGYLIELKNRRQKDPETTFSRNMLTGTVTNFFGAGSETVRTSVEWGLYIVAAFKDVQKKVQAEIDEVIGRERMPSWICHKEMPFTYAVIMEAQRWKTIVPLNLLRYTLADTKLQGYHIPKGTTVIANFWAAHHDPDDWEEPFEFKPSRFLSKDGKTVIKPESFMPFSTGKRSCPGEILALIEVFLYFTSILQRFDVEIPKNTPVTFEAELGLTYHLKSHKLCFKSRT